MMPELHQHYRESMEDQLGTLGLALNAVVLFNSLYTDAAVKQLAADGFPVTDELLARLSPLQYDHINFLGHYAFTGRPRRACGSCATQTPRTRAMANSLGTKAVPLGHLL
ncbi:Tn3 family transposase [Streptomyces sp. NPDC001315]|uniref:Tn3 family transposase n=1 Tax=Streptomyces sp. NPDC001315 TaxID=3364562 RepID=UPI0036D027CD